MKHWLIKSEPDEYSIEDLRRDKRTDWVGVRNYEARNNLQAMEPGDPFLFYHSSTDPAGVAGIGKVSKKAAPDPEQFDAKSDYYDPKAKPDEPRWFAPELQFAEKFSVIVPLEKLRARAELKEMTLLKKGSRLSVQPVTPKQFAIIAALGGSAKTK